LALNLVGLFKNKKAVKKEKGLNNQAQSPLFFIQRYPRSQAPPGNAVLKALP